MLARRTSRVLGIMLTLVVLLDGPLSLAAKRWKLRLDLEPEQTFRYVMNQSQRVRISMGELGEQTSDARTRLELSQKVLEVEADGSVVLEMRLDRIKMEMGEPGTSSSFDTALPAEADGDDPLLEAQRAIVGKPFSVKMSRRGEVLQVGNMQQLEDAVVDSLPEGVSDGGLLDAFRLSFGEQALKSMMEQSAVIFPEKAVRAGSSWSREFEMDSPALGTMTIHAEYSVIGLESRGHHECVRLEVRQQISFDGESQVLAQMTELFAQRGTEVALDVSIGDAAATGTLWIDRELGLVTDTELDQTLEVAIAVDAPSMSAQTTRVTMTIESRVETRMLE